jgi:hypothetical protein
MRGPKKILEQAALLKKCVLGKIRRSAARKNDSIAAGMSPQKTRNPGNNQILGGDTTSGGVRGCAPSRTTIGTRLGENG